MHDLTFASLQHVKDLWQLVSVLPVRRSRSFWLRDGDAVQVSPQASIELSDHARTAAWLGVLT